MNLRPQPHGWPQSIAALLVAGAAAGVIAASSWNELPSAGRLAFGGVVFFAIALILGSGRLVALSGVLILPAGLMTFAGNDDPAWARGVVIGVLWYLAAELAWDAIERRDGVRRTGAFNNRRLEEASRVVLLSLAIAAVAVLLSGVAPLRTVFVLAVALGAVAVALASATGVVRRHGGVDPSRTPPPGMMGGERRDGLVVEVRLGRAVDAETD